MTGVFAAGEEGSVERALAGDFVFEPFGVLECAWRATDGVKMILLVGVALMMLISIVVQQLTRCSSRIPAGLPAHCF